MSRNSQKRFEQIFLEVASKIRQDNDDEIIDLLKSSDNDLTLPKILYFLELIIKVALTSTEKMGTVMQIIINLPEKINFLQYEEPYGSIAMKYLLQVEGIKADDKVFFIKTLHEHSFYHESEVFEFFKTLVQEVEKNFLLKERVGDLLCFVKGSEDFLVHKAEYSTRHEVLQIAKRLFNSSLKRNVTAETREIVRRVLKTLKVVIDEASRDGIDESFLQMIDMVKEDKILTSKPVVNDIHREANFFLHEAPKLLQPIGIYVKGIKKLQAVGCHLLAMEIILKCESKIREECKKKDGQDYPDEEMLIMGYFYAEIGFQKLVPGERVKQMIELLEKKERNEGLQSGCSKVVKMGYTMGYKMLGVPIDSSEPLSKYVPSFIMELWNNVETEGLKYALGAALVNQEMMEFFLFTLCTKAAENPRKILEMGNLAVEVVENPQYNYDLKDFQIFVIKLSAGLLGQMNNETFKVVILKLLELFFDRGMISKLTIVKVWLRICSDQKYMWNEIPNFLQTIEKTKKFVNGLNGDEEILNAIAVRNYLKLKQKHESLQKFRKNFDDVIKYFDRLLIGKTAKPTKITRMISRPSISKEMSNYHDLKGFTDIEKKLIARNIFGLFHSTEKMKNILKSFKSNKSADPQEVLEMFSMIAVNCLEENQVKPYVERIMKDLERENYACLVMKLLKINLIQQAQRVKSVEEIKNFSILAEEIHKKSKISVETLVKILKTLATTENIENLFQAFPFFIKKFRNFLNFQNLPEISQKPFIEIYRIVENVKNQGVYYEHQKNLQEVLLLLNIPTQPPDPISIINTELRFDYLPRGEDGVNIYFEHFVKTFSRQEQDAPVVIKVFYLEEEARYFVKNAIQDEEAAMKFGSIMGSLRDTPSMKLLLEKIVEVTEEKFFIQHNHETQSESSKNEVLSTLVLIVKMINALIMSPERFVELAYFIFRQPKFLSPSIIVAQRMADNIKWLIEIEKTEVLGGITWYDFYQKYFEDMVERLPKGSRCLPIHEEVNPKLIAKRIDLLAAKGMEFLTLMGPIVSAAKLLLNEKCPQFTLDSLKERFENKLCKEIQGLVTVSRQDFNHESEKVVLFNLKLLARKIFCAPQIVRIWKVLADLSRENFFIGSTFLTIVACCQDSDELQVELQSSMQKKLGKKTFHEHLTEIYNDLITYVNKRNQLTNEHTYTAEMSSCLNNLQSILNGSNSTNNHAKSAAETQRTPNASELQNKNSKRPRKPKSKPKIEKPPKPEDELKTFLTSTEKIEEEKLATIIGQIGAREQGIRNAAKAFFDSVSNIKNVGKFAHDINSHFESLEGASDDVTFQKVLVTMLQNSFKKLPKFDQLTSDEETSQAEAAVKLTGELYNIGWIDQSKLISCMDKLSANNFGSDLQLKMFLYLLRNVEAEMTRQKHIGKSKYYIDLLILSETSKKVQNLKCIEVLRRISTTKDNKKQADTDKRFDELVNQLVDKTLTEAAKNLMTIITNNSDERILSLIKKFTEKALEKPELFAKLLKASKSSFFVSLVVDQCQEDFLELTNVEKIEQKIIDLAKFIGELYNEDLATEELVKVCMDVLFGVKISCEVTIDSISILITTVRVKMENSDKEKFDRYFKYFDFIIEQKEESYRSKVFEFLVAMRKNEWKCDQNAIKPLVDYHLDQLCDKEVLLITLNLQQLMKDSVEIAIAIIRKIWEIVIQKPELIEVCGKLTKEMSKAELDQDGSKMNFGEVLVQFLTKRHETFMTIPDDQYNEKVKNRLGQVVTFAAELYKLKIISDELLMLWLDEKLIEKITVDHATQLSTILTKMFNDIENIHLKVKLAALDEKINADVTLFTQSLRQEIEELKKNISLY